MVDESESKQSVTDKQEDTIERSSATSTAHLMSLNSRRSTNLWSRTMRCWYGFTLLALLSATGS